MNRHPRLRVGVVVIDDERLLLVRRGVGPAGGVWDVPTSDLEGGRTIAETVVNALSGETGLEGAMGPLVGVQELLGDDDHEVRLVVQADSFDDGPLVVGGAAVEARWFPFDELGTIRFASGLAEFLHDHGLLALLT